MVMKKMDTFLPTNFERAILERGKEVQTFFSRKLIFMAVFKQASDSHLHTPKELTGLVEN